MNIIRIIKEEILKFNKILNPNERYLIEDINSDWSDDEESLADKFYNKSLGISTNNKTINKSDFNDDISGTLIGSLNNGYFKDNINIYLNPKSLTGFLSRSRGVVFTNGDLYIANSPYITHYNIIDFLSKKNILPDNMKNWYHRIIPTDFIAVVRNNDSNEFFESESYYKTTEIYKKTQTIFNKLNKISIYYFTINKH